jgi:hypothetical protein
VLLPLQRDAMDPTDWHDKQPGNCWCVSHAPARTPSVHRLLAAALCVPLQSEGARTQVNV